LGSDRGSDLGRRPAWPRAVDPAEPRLVGEHDPQGTTTGRRRPRGASHTAWKAEGKDIVSRTWRKLKGDWDVWNFRSLADEPIVRLILDGTVVRVRLDRKATAISLLVVIGVRADGQKVLLGLKAWAAKAPKPGAPCSTISSNAVCGGPSS
jgi:Transposase, Mutator family